MFTNFYFKENGASYIVTTFGHSGKQRCRGPHFFNQNTSKMLESTYVYVVVNNDGEHPKVYCNLLLISLLPINALCPLQPPSSYIGRFDSFTWVSIF